jgi:hypothetical protein
MPLINRLKPFQLKKDILNKLGIIFIQNHLLAPTVCARYRNIRNKYSLSTMFKMFTLRVEWPNSHRSLREGHWFGPATEEPLMPWGHSLWGWLLTKELQCFPSRRAGLGWGLQPEQEGMPGSTHRRTKAERQRGEGRGLQNLTTLGSGTQQDNK